MKNFWERPCEGYEVYKDWEVRNDLLNSGLSEREVENFVSFVCRGSLLPDWVEEKYETRDSGTVDEMCYLVYYRGNSPTNLKK